MTNSNVLFSLKQTQDLEGDIIVRIDYRPKDSVELSTLTQSLQAINSQYNLYISKQGFIQRKNPGLTLEVDKVIEGSICVFIKAKHRESGEIIIDWYNQILVGNKKKLSSVTYKKGSLSRQEVKYAKDEVKASKGEEWKSVLMRINNGKEVILSTDTFNKEELSTLNKNCSIELETSTLELETTLQFQGFNTENGSAKAIAIELTPLSIPTFMSDEIRSQFIKYEKDDSLYGSEFLVRLQITYRSEEPSRYTIKNYIGR